MFGEKDILLLGIFFLKVNLSRKKYKLQIKTDKEFPIQKITT